MALSAGWVLMRPAITLTDRPECGMEEHTHTDDCYTQQTGPAPFVCTLEYHEHGDNCFDAEGNLVCEQQEHIHSESCYGQPETDQVLTCTVPEHTHSEECYPVPEPTPAYTVGPVPECGMAEHVHGEDCYDGEDLICTVPQHTHSDSCYPQPETEPPETEAAEETTEPTEAAEETAEPTEAEEETAEPTEADLTPLETLRQRLGIETEEDSTALDALLEQYGLTPEEILEGLQEIEEDPEADKIDSLEALKALLEATAEAQTLDVTLESNEAVFTNIGPNEWNPKSGVTLTLPDGVTVEVKEKYAGNLIGYILRVDEETTSREPFNHGQVVIDKGYEIRVLDQDKKDCTVSGDFEITITSPEAFTEDETPQIYRRNDAGELEAYPNLSMDAERKTVSGSVTQFPTKILIDHWDYSDAKYEDWPGAEYSIAYVLQNYNLFLSGDYSGTHVVGPMIVNSVSKTSGLGGLSAGESRYLAPHYVPDYIGALKGSLTYIPGGVITANPNTPVYFGKTIKDLNLTNNLVDAGTGNEADNQNYWYTKNYIDFTAAMNTISGEMGTISKTSEERPTCKNGSDEGKKDYTLPAGGVYEIPAGFFQKHADGGNTTWDTLYLTDDTGEADTILIFRDAEVTLPTLVDSSGSDFGNTESGKSTGVVFFCPNATTVNGQNVTGHLVAPNAAVNYAGGNYNGCVIARDMVTTAEGHMWPYKGSRLVPERTSVHARKYINGEPMAETDTREFTFSLYRQNESEDGFTYEEKPAATGYNAGPNVTFAYINFSEAGEYVYKMVENMDKTHPGIIFDSRAYYVKIVVTANGSRFKAAISYFKDEACTQPLDEGQTYPVFNNRYGETLPATGGPGTSVSILPGVFLTALALAGLCISRKRRAA